MPGTPPTSAPLGWAQAASSWFRKDYDVLGRVFVVTATVRLVLAIHTVVVSSWFIYPTAGTSLGWSSPWWSSSCGRFPSRCC